jgi:hypothetical protein
MTLDEMYQEIASYVDEIITKIDGAYEGTSLSIVNRFKSSINTIKDKIARERYAPIAVESVELTDETLDIGDLNNRFLRVKDIGNDRGSHVKWYWKDHETIHIPRQTNVTIRYYYIPDDIEELEDEWVYDQNIVTPKIACFYAAWFYLSQETDADSMVRANLYLNLFNDAYDAIPITRGETHKIRDVYGVSLC